MFQFWQFHGVFTHDVVYLSCFILQQEIFSSDLKSFEVELWNILSFIKKKGYHKVLIFGCKSSWLGTHFKDNTNKKIKDIVIIHVCNWFGMRLLRFWWGYGVIFNKIKSECSWECFIFFFYCETFSICVWWKEKGRDVVMFFYEWFYGGQILFFS